MSKHPRPVAAGAVGNDAASAASASSAGPGNAVAAAAVDSDAAMLRPRQLMQEHARQHIRQASQGICLLLALADVELRLCMQPLDTRSRLVLARCSRRLLH